MSDDPKTDRPATLEELQAILAYLRTHRTCECCGKEMTLLGPDKNNPPYGLWVHSHTGIKDCYWDDIENFEAQMEGRERRELVECSHEGAGCGCLGEAADLARRTGRDVVIEPAGVNGGRFLVSAMEGGFSVRSIGD